MCKETTTTIEKRLFQDSRLTLEDYLREGARKMLKKTIEEEVNKYLENHRFLRAEKRWRKIKGYELMTIAPFYKGRSVGCHE